METMRMKEKRRSLVGMKENRRSMRMVTPMMGLILPTRMSVEAGEFMVSVDSLELVLFRGVSGFVVVPGTEALVSGCVEEGEAGQQGIGEGEERAEAEAGGGGGAGGEGGAKTSHLEMAETECNQMKSLILVMLGENTSGFRQVVCPTFPSSRQFLGREGKLQFQKLLVTLSTCFSRMNLWEK